MDQSLTSFRSKGIALTPGSWLGRAGTPWLLVVLHIPIGLAAHLSGEFASVYALATLLGTFALALTTSRLHTIAVASAYIVGAEVLFRMTSAGVPYEIGKYSLAVIFGVALMRFFARWKGMGLPVLYLALLIPSSWLTLERFGLSDAARQYLSFNLSGPLSLALAVLFFRQCRFQWQGVRAMIWAILVGVAAIATVALYATVTAESLTFEGGSEFTTSGGFGPNQVSAVLGLGGMFAIYLAVREGDRASRIFALILAVWFLSQASLTFSRGGLYNVVAALLLAAIQYIRAPRRRAVFVATLSVLFLLGAYVVVPRLDAFTGGALNQRFQDTNTTRRGELLQADLRLFSQNPAFGIGPGVATADRNPRELLAAHTEYTRALAEHGVLGAMSLICLIAIGVGGYRRADSPLTRAWVMLTLGWAATEMGHAAMRIAAIPFLIGLAMFTWERKGAT